MSGFDNLARQYQALEYLAFGRALERARYAYLDRLAAADRVLVLGEGDGRALSRLVALHPKARIDVVDVSAAMIALARKRIGNFSHVRFHQQDALACDWPRLQFDAVVTHFFLDCFSEPEASELIARVRAAMKPGALWLVSDFAIPAHGWRRLHALIWVRAMYWFFGAFASLRTRRLPDIQTLLKQAGLQQVERGELRAGLIHFDLWQLPSASSHPPDRSSEPRK